MNLLPLYCEVQDNDLEHKLCRFRIDALLPDIDYNGCVKSGCVSMNYIKVCDKCKKFKYIGIIPVPINPETVKKYGIDTERYVNISEKIVYKIETVYDKHAKHDFQQKAISGDKIVKKTANYPNGETEVISEETESLPYRLIEKLIQRNRDKWSEYLVSRKFDTDKNRQITRYVQKTEDGIKIYWKRVIKF